VLERLVLAARRAAKRDLGTVERVVLAGFALAIAVGFAWGLPGTNTWAIDSISPRACGLGAIVETYWSGHFHTYPPLHTLILTLLSVPWIGLAVARVGATRAALEVELIKPLYMTGIEVSARLVAAAMAIGFVWNTMRLWRRIEGRTAARAAGAIVATNATFVYYAHTGNLEVPYLFWSSWALVEMDRALRGDARELPVLLLSGAAVLSKDQAAAVLLLPLLVAIVVGPWAARGLSPLRRPLLRAVAIAGLAYALVSGLLVNPSGYRRRVAFLLGPASQSWALYPRGYDGAMRLARDAIGAIPHFTSWPIAILAIVGVLVVAVTRRGVDRVRAAQPLLAAVSFTWLFTLGARRSEDRFLLPQTLFVLPYAAVVFARLWASRPFVAKAARRAQHSALLVAGLACLAPALVGVASMDGTLLVDARYEAERFLTALPPATHVEVLGTSPFLPRLPTTLDLVRPGIDPVGDRAGIPGVQELVDPAMDPRPRAPDYIVLATVLSLESVTAPPPPPALRPFGSTPYHDDASHRLYRDLLNGSLGYTRALSARCVLPWPLECRFLHDATGREVWIYARQR
jgi:hypothetical protein